MDLFLYYYSAKSRTLHLSLEVNCPITSRSHSDKCKKVRFIINIRHVIQRFFFFLKVPLYGAHVHSIMWQSCLAVSVQEEEQRSTRNLHDWHHRVQKLSWLGMVANWQRGKPRSRADVAWVLSGSALVITHSDRGVLHVCTSGDNSWYPNHPAVQPPAPKDLRKKMCIDLEGRVQGWGYKSINNHETKPSFSVSV